MKTLFALAGAFLFLALLVALFSRSSGRSYRYKRKPLMTPNEREFYGRLTHALPEYLVFPQLAMSGVITPATGSRDRGAWAKIRQKVVDFGVYTHDFQLICLVELDDRTHRKDRDAARDMLTGSAGIKTLRWQSNAKPASAEIAQAVAHIVSTPMPSEGAAVIPKP